MNEPHTPTCVHCDAGMVATRKKDAISAGGIIGAIVVVSGLLYMLVNFVVGLLMLVGGVVLGTVTRGDHVVLTCPVCGYERKAGDLS